MARARMLFDEPQLHTRALFLQPHDGVGVQGAPTTCHRLTSLLLRCTVRTLQQLTSDPTAIRSIGARQSRPLADRRGLLNRVSMD